MDPLRREMRQHAGALVHRLARVGLELAYDREGVAALDHYVEDNRALWSSADRDRLAIELGAFVGECIVETYDLRWQAGETLALPDHTSVAPRLAARTRLDGGARLTELFDRIGDALARA
jgi:hypothetical protein